MSKEFEGIVLKIFEKLDVLDERTKNIETTQQEHGKRLENLETGFKDTNQRLGKVEIELKDTQEVVKYLNQNFIKFDCEINKKIDALFDAYSANKESNVVHEENIVSLNSKVFNHDIRISNLEKKVLTV